MNRSAMVLPVILVLVVWGWMPQDAGRWFRTSLFAPVTSTALAASEPEFSIAQTEQIDRGKGIFQTSCSKCHGTQGQGGDGPRLIGSPNGLSGYNTAQGLFDFASSEMPADSPGSLKAEEYWDVLAFILDANKLLPPNTVLGPENAANIRLSP